MATVFISYRREENAGDARALCNDLADILGKNSVFMDVDSIALGRDFREVLRERLSSCDLMLVLIGKGWVEARDKAGQRRLDQPDDFVRQEVAAALKRNIPVTPVLLQGATMPSPEQLPEDLSNLAFRNAFELSYTRWQSDLAEMAKRLELSGPAPAAKPASNRSGLFAGLGAAAVALAAIGYFVIRPSPDPGPMSPPPAAATSRPAAPTGSVAANSPALNAAAQAPSPLPSSGQHSYAVLLSSDSTIGTGGAKDELAKAVEFANANPPAAQPAMFLRNNVYATALLFETREAASEALPKIQGFRWKTAYVADLRQVCGRGFGTEAKVREGIPYTNCDAP